MNYGIDVCDGCGLELRTKFGQSYPIEHDKGWTSVSTRGIGSYTFCPKCADEITEAALEKYKNGLNVVR